MTGDRPLACLVAGLLIAAIALAFWIWMAGMIVLADLCGPAPFAIYLGVALSTRVQAIRSSDARGRRRAPSARDLR